MESWLFWEDVGRYFLGARRSNTILGKVICFFIPSIQTGCLFEIRFLKMLAAFRLDTNSSAKSVPKFQAPMRQISVLGARTDEIQELMFLQRWEKGSCLLASLSILTLPKFMWNLRTFGKAAPFQLMK